MEKPWDWGIDNVVTLTSIAVFSMINSNMHAPEKIGHNKSFKKLNIWYLGTPHSWRIQWQSDNESTKVKSEQEEK